MVSASGEVPNLRVVWEGDIPKVIGDLAADGGINDSLSYGMHQHYWNEEQPGLEGGPLFAEVVAVDDEIEQHFEGVRFTPLSDLDALQRSDAALATYPFLKGLAQEMLDSSAATPGPEHTRSGRFLIKFAGGVMVESPYEISVKTTEEGEING